MKQLSFLCAFVMVCNSLICQTISGKIVDTNNNPIAYATLQIGPNYGVITNEEGDFTMETHDFSDSDIVSISCLGYKSQEYKISDFNKKSYKLESSISELSEVFITNKPLSIEEILTNVRANISKNYSNEGRQRIFKRETHNVHLQDFDFDLVKSSNLKKSKIKRFNQQFDSIKGGLVDNNSRFYEDALIDMLHIADSSQIAVIKATKLVNKEKDLSTEAVNGKAIKNVLNILDSTATYKFKSGLFTIEDSLKFGSVIKDNTNSQTGKTKALKSQISKIIENNTLVEDSNLDFIFEEEAYEYTIEGISYIDEDAAYIISFEPNKRSAKYIGKMYVNTIDFAVVKLQYQFAENRTGEKLNLKLLMGIKFEENAYRSTVIFKRNKNDTYSLYFISQESGNYVYLNRSLKFIRNNTIEQKDKQILKLNLMIEQNQRGKVELFFIESSSTVDPINSNQTEEYTIDYISRYDASIWKDYNVLSPVKAILDYETE